MTDLQISHSQLRSLIQIAIQLNRTMASTDRHLGLLNQINLAFPSDASCLMSLEEDTLVVLAQRGLGKNTSAKYFRLADHPRLSMIAASQKPIIFPHDSPIPDPFDGLIDSDCFATMRIHSCIGCPLFWNGSLVGMLTMDSQAPFKFDYIDMDLLHLVSALAGATLSTALLMERSDEKRVEREISIHTRVSSAESGIEVSKLLGSSRALDDIRMHLSIVSGCDLPVLIQGETGTGKEVLARHIHAQSRRSSTPICYVNCAALPESIIESELFGHIKGSFTGAHTDRMGKFQLAHNGTLFLDEIGELPLSVQPKLLRVLQEGEVQKIGSDKAFRVNARVIAATNRNLQEEMAQGRFRSDLFHRLGVYPIELPSLRNRKDDIMEIANHFACEFQKQYQTSPIRFDDGAQELLINYRWPGNIRELKNIIARITLGLHYQRPEAKVLFVSVSDITRYLSVGKVQGNHGQDAWASYDGASLKEATKIFQKNFILDKYHSNKNNWARTAQALGTDRSNLYNLAKRLGIVQ